jgi:hypothetical protein
MSRIEQYVQLTLDQRSGPNAVWLWAPDVQRVDEFAKGGSRARAVVHTLHDKLYVRETPAEVLALIGGIPQVDRKRPPVWAGKVFATDEALVDAWLEERGYRKVAGSQAPAGRRTLDELAEVARDAYWTGVQHSPWAECGEDTRREWRRVVEAVWAANASTPLTRDMPLGSVELAQALYAVEYGYSSCSEALYHTDQQTRTIYAARANKLAKWLAGRRLAP